MYIWPLPLFMALPFRALVLSPSCSFEVVPTGSERHSTFPKKPPFGLLLIFLSSSFSNRIYSYRMNNDMYHNIKVQKSGTHIFLSIVVVGVGVWLCRRMQVCTCFTVPSPWPFVIRSMRERKDWTSAHTVAWLHLHTKSSLWRTSCVRIFALVGMLVEVSQHDSGRCLCFCCAPL